MRASSDGTPLGGIYVPVGHHLKIQIAEQANSGGWYKYDASCPSNIAC